MTRMILLRAIVLLTVVVGANYVIWRWLFSLNWDAWWIAVPLIAAETYSFIDVALFGLTVWTVRARPLPPPPAADATVDVFIATYNEPIDLVLGTARAAAAIRFPHQTWVLDDGARPQLKAAVEAAGIGYITRSADWLDRPRHAKAGNLNNALLATTGEFILVLDADQVPRPGILDNTLGYFTDERVAFVQTPQVFTNVLPEDPLGSQAPLFYGPIQQGKDAWNAAFFCGSNAVLRREALMQLGIVGYVAELDRSLGTALHAAQRVVKRARRHDAAKDPAVLAALAEVGTAIDLARAELKAGAPLASITFDLHRRVDAAAQSIVALDIASLESDLREIREMAAAGAPARHTTDTFDIDHAIDALSHRDLSPLNAIDSVRAVLRTIAIDRPGEAQPVMPLSIISVTEDMATSMQLHGLGWKSVYHHETLADGLAPEDAGTMLTQRLRWAQGTMQVLLRQNPLTQRALSVPQRLMYFATMWSYLAGFAAVIYFAAPVIFLVTGILPVASDGAEFFLRFIPLVMASQLLFIVAAHGAPTWRGQQYSLALFPVWIKACTSAFANVFFGVPLAFAVTPKTRQRLSLQTLLAIKAQLAVMVILVVAIVIGCINLVWHDAEPIGTAVNIAWAVFDLVVLSVLFKAIAYRGFARRRHKI